MVQLVQMIRIVSCFSENLSLVPYTHGNSFQPLLTPFPGHLNIHSSLHLYALINTHTQNFLKKGFFSFFLLCVPLISCILIHHFPILRILFLPSSSVTLAISKCSVHLQVASGPTSDCTAVACSSLQKLCWERGSGAVVSAL